jgi:high-affinity iron transporter
LLPTFVIGLREGLEAALIVGIVAAFLSQRGRRDLLRLAFLGVAGAVLLCLAIGVVLDVISHDLPQRQQEGMETVIGACAVAMVTYMVVWMRRHSRTLKAQLEGAASEALAAGSGLALVLMAFLAVLREGLETVVFLLAAFNQSGNSALAGLGAVLGIAVAVVLGWGIYRGGVRLNLSRFFRFTGVVLTFVAAGLVVSALHTAHEAGWLTAGQQSTVDLSALVRPGSVQAALLTGMLGVQPHPVLIEVIGWLVYIVPVGLYVAWPPGRALARRTVNIGLLATGALSLIAAIVLAALLPVRPAPSPVTRAADGNAASIVSRSARDVLIRTTVPDASQSTQSTGSTPDAQPGAARLLTATAAGSQRHAGLQTDVYRVSVTVAVAHAPSTMTYDELAQRNEGRLPLGVRAGDGVAAAPVSETSVDVGTFWVQSTTARIVDLRWQQTTTLTAHFDIGPTVIGTPSVSTWQLPTSVVASAAAHASNDAATLSRRNLMSAIAVACLVVAALTMTAASTLALRRRRLRRPGRVAGSTAQRIGSKATPLGVGAGR